MPFRDKNLTVARVDEHAWQLVEPLIYDGNDDTIVVPAGHRTDFASVPRSLQWLAPSTGRYTLAAVLHDYLCDSMVGGYTLFDVLHEDLIISAREVDGLFRRVMREEGVGVVQRWLLWGGVRIGAIRNPARRPGTLRDVPVLLASALVVAPFILPPLALIGVARLAYAAAEWVAGWFSAEESA